MNNIKYLFLKIKIHDGNRIYTVYELHSTKCNSIKFAIVWYLAHYWGYAQIDRYYKPQLQYWFDGEFMIELDFYKVLTKEDYQRLSDLFYSRVI